MPSKNHFLLLVRIAPENIIDESQHTTAATVRLLGETLMNIRDTRYLHAFNSEDNRTICIMIESLLDDQQLMNLLKNPHAHDGLRKDQRARKFLLKGNDVALLVRMLNQYSDYNLDLTTRTWLEWM